MIRNQNGIRFLNRNTSIQKKIGEFHQNSKGKLLFMADFRNRNDSPGRGWVDWKKLSRSGSHPGGVSVLQDLGPGAN